MMNIQEHNILVYRSKPIPISETFVYNQSVRLERYKAFILGIRRPSSPSIEIPKEQIILINQGGIIGFIHELLFRFFGIVPKTVLRRIVEINPQLIHAHFGIDGTYILPLAKKLRVPLVVSFLGTDATLKDEIARFSSLGQNLYLIRRKRLIHEAEPIVVPSKFLKKKVIEHGFSKEKIKLIHHGVDLQIFSPSNKNFRQGHIVFVGRLVPVKGLDYLIKALGEISKDVNGFFLSIIGDGPMRAEYETLAGIEIGNGYQFLGSQPHEVVRDLLSTCDVFSVPSVSLNNGQAESFGLVFAEAQAMGIPVVSFDSGGISEVVENGVTGILVQEKNVEYLAKALKQLLIAPDLRNKMSKAARERAVRMFDLKKQNAKLESLYDEILDKN
jgi:colanic acid/amylovoran biosynthesis glycosyltransferase